MPQKWIEIFFSDCQIRFQIIYSLRAIIRSTVSSRCPKRAALELLRRAVLQQTKCCESEAIFLSYKEYLHRIFFSFIFFASYTQERMPAETAEGYVDGGASATDQGSAAFKDPPQVLY